MIRPGEEWGRPTTAAPDLEVAGGDADLAAAVSACGGALVRFRPDGTSDLAGAVGLGPGPSSRGIELPLDLLRLDDGRAGANMVVIGAPPDAVGRFSRRFGANVRVDDKPLFHGPCTTIVIATGQFRRGLDLVPRGHPGDGRAEVQVYCVRARERPELRARLATGTHVPHPGITQRSGARIDVTADRRVALEVDGRPESATDLVRIRVEPNAYRLLL